jgi:hypothetical protein
MRYLLLVAVAMLLGLKAHAQPAMAPTIEGYWQDIAGRITFKRNPLPADRYGDWYERPLDATYPVAKHIRRSGPSFELVDLNYDEKDYSVRVLNASEDQIDFVRSASWSPCRVLHSCRLAGAELFCAMEHLCLEGGKEHVDLRAEERFVRRGKCERTQTRHEAQGFPVACH